MYEIIIIIILLAMIATVIDMYVKTLSPETSFPAASKADTRQGKEEGLPLPAEKTVPAAAEKETVKKEEKDPGLEACKNNDLGGIISDMKANLRRGDKGDMFIFDNTADRLNDYFSCMAYKELDGAQCDEMNGIFDKISKGLKKEDKMTLGEYVKSCKNPNAAMTAYAAGYDREPKAMDFIADYLSEYQGLDKNKALKDLQKGIENLYIQNDNRQDLLYDFPKSDKDCLQFCKTNSQCTEKCKENINIFKAFSTGNVAVCAKNKDRSVKYSRCFYMFNRKNENACEEEKEKVIDAYCKPLIEAKIKESSGTAAGTEEGAQPGTAVSTQAVAK